METRYPTILSEQEYTARLPQIIRDLDALKTAELIPGAKGTPLYCERYVKEGSRGNIVIVHGFSEFAEKYKEMIWYYLALGLNVFIYDQRGHGLSGREVSDPDLIHVSAFDDYVKDLKTVIDRQVLPHGSGLPVYLFSHSMGGAVVALYLLQHPAAVQKAVLSSPMIAPKTMHIPVAVVKRATRQCARRDGWEARFPYTRGFDADVDFADALDGCKARFRSALELRIKHPEYRCSCATNRWMLESLRVKDRILNRKQAAGVRAEVLILSAGEETVVKNRLSKRFSRMLQRCRYVTVPNTKHNIFAASGQVLEDYYRVVFDFLC